MKYHGWICVAFCIATIVGSDSPVSADVQLLPVTSYSSAADSPFDLNGLGETFFLEDMETGGSVIPTFLMELQTPWTIKGPGPRTDSVDSDDGRLDGSGSEGHSLVPLLVDILPTNPPQRVATLSVALGENVNAFGLVWTDAFAVNALEIGVSTASGFHRFDTTVNMDGDPFGFTDEDMFVGLLADERIFEITIRCISVGFEDGDPCEFDHIQLGSQAVPEPDMFPACFLSFVLVALRNHRMNVRAIF